MSKLRILWILLLLVGLAIPTGSALAAPGSNPLDRIITGDDYILDDGETEDGNVVVLGGSVEIRAGAVLDGDLIVMGGDVEIGGTVTGNVVVMGGDVQVLEAAHIEGDCVLVGGDVAIDQGALIDGDVVTNPEEGWLPFGRDRGEDGRVLPTIPAMPTIPAIPEIPRTPETPVIPARPEVVYHSRAGFAERVGGAFLSAIAAGVVALLIALFLPRHTDQVRQVVVREPAMSGVVGFLTFLAAVLLTPILAVISALLVLVCIGLLGFPIIIALWLAIAAGSMLGFAAIGQLAGRWISERLNLTGMTVALETGLGAFALSLAVGLIQAIGCVIGVVGGLLNLVIFSLALGAVVLTRFGRQDYRSGQPILPQWTGRRPTPPTPPVAPVAPGEAPDALEPEPPADEDSSEPDLDTEGPFPNR